MKPDNYYDVAIIGCGIAGMATAMRLQHKGLSTVILEAHGQPGGCAGYFKKKGFVFDVGATTLVDFDEYGVGGEFFRSIGMKMPASDLLDYRLWLPDKEIDLYFDKVKWEKERLAKFGDSDNHRAFWIFMDQLADVFWNSSRKGIKLPIQNAMDIVNAIRALGITNLPLLKYVNHTMLDALKMFGLEKDVVLKSALAMLIEDTVHSTLDKAPLINSALGITIRGAGMRRAKGGMKGLWDHLVFTYKERNGVLKLGHKVFAVNKNNNGFEIITRKGIFYSKKLVSALPVQLTEVLVPDKISRKISNYTRRDNNFLGGAIVVFLGVPEEEVDTHETTHHQLLYDYSLPLGNGNNMFISISSPGDLKSAPVGYRAVMLSTHCDLHEWKELSEEEYQSKKENIGQHLIHLARKVYPNLATNPVIYEVGTPRTYYKFAGRPDGAVGGVRQSFKNTNLNALPHDIGVKNFRLAGDSTWPGLGTVACMLGSRIVANQLTR